MIFNIGKKKKTYTPFWAAIAKRDFYFYDYRTNLCTQYPLVNMVCVIVNCNYLVAWIIMTFYRFKEIAFHLSAIILRERGRKKINFYSVFAIESSIKCCTFRLVWLDYCWLLRIVPFTDLWIPLHCCSFAQSNTRQWLFWYIKRMTHNTGLSSETRVSHEPEL